MTRLILYKDMDSNYAGKQILKNDSCGKKTVAVIVNKATMIALCEDCLENFKTIIENRE